MVLCRGCLMEIERLDNEVVLDFPAAFEAQPSNFKKSKESLRIARTVANPNLRQLTLVKGSRGRRVRSARADRTFTRRECYCSSCRKRAVEREPRLRPLFKRNNVLASPAPKSAMPLPPLPLEACRAGTASPSHADGAAAQGNCSGERNYGGSP
jgi:hypothetical protein